MKVKIEIDTKTFIRFWLVVIGFGLAGLTIYLAQTALVILGTALFLALALNRPVARLAKLIPGKSRLGGTALAFTLLIVFLFCVVWFVVPPIVQQTAKFAESVPEIIDQASTQWHGVNRFIDEHSMREQVNSVLESIRTQASHWATDLSGSIIGSVGSLASFVTSLFLVIVLSFLMLLEGPEWMRRVWGLYDNQARMEHHKRLVGRIYNVITGYVAGQLTVSGIGSLVAGAFVFGISLFVPAIDANLVMPTILIVFVLSLIPMFGATIAGVLVTLLLAFNNVPAGIAYAVFFVVYQQIENNFISPAIQSKKVELSALMVLTAVTVGLYVAGVAGGFIAIPIAGTIKVFLDDYLERAKAKREESKHDKPVLGKLASKLKKSAPAE